MVLLHSSINTEPDGVIYPMCVHDGVLGHVCAAGNLYVAANV